MKEMGGTKEKESHLSMDIKGELERQTNMTDDTFSVDKWLASLKLEMYTNTFLDNGYDDEDVISEITNEDLDSAMGITLPDHKKRILKACQELQENGWARVAPNTDTIVAPPPPTKTSTINTYGKSPSPPAVPISILANAAAAAAIALNGTSAGASAGTVLTTPASPSPSKPKPPKPAKIQSVLLLNSNNNGPASPSSERRSSSISEEMVSRQSRPLIRSSTTPEILLNEEDMRRFSSMSSSGSSAPAKPPRADNRKMGYLSKQGGSNKGWRRRWVVFQDNKIAYFKDRSDREPAGLVALHDIKEVRRQVSFDVKYGYQFALDTGGRVYMFSAETEQEMQEWVSLLQKAVTKYVPSPDDALLGGSMNNPEKGGWLKKQGNNVAKDWKRRYVALKGGSLCYYKTFEDYKSGTPINTINTLTITVKNTTKKNQMQIVTLNRSFWFLAETQQEMDEWITAIQNSILYSLNHNQSDKSRAQDKGSVETITGDTALENIKEHKLHDNCVDCSAEGPDWASISLGVVMCIECSGIHRSMGVHLSKVRSITLDEWRPTLLGVIKAIGNENANTFWEREVPSEYPKPMPSTSRGPREAFIRAKYADKLFIGADSVVVDGVSLDERLLSVVMGDDLLATVELIARGADPRYTSSDGRTALHVAAEVGQTLQAELLLQNGCDVDATNGMGYTTYEVAEAAGHSSLAAMLRVSSCGMVKMTQPLASSTCDDDVYISRERWTGWLYKQGGSNKGWKKRWFVADEYSVRYYRTETDREPAGIILFSDATGVFLAEEESLKDPKYQYCFELRTSRNRNYMVCAESETEMIDWTDALNSCITAAPPRESALDLSQCTRRGYLFKRGGTNTARKRRWFVLKGKEIMYFKDENDRELLGTVDLRQMVKVELGEGKNKTDKDNKDKPNSFHIQCDSRNFILHADSVDEATSWVKDIYETQVFGVDMALLAKNTDTKIPHIVTRCTSFLAEHGLEQEGIYRVPGSANAIQQLRTSFNQDAEQVDFEDYTCADVGGVLKLYFRELPEPLLTTAMYQNFIDAVCQPSHNDRLCFLQDCAFAIPRENFETLKCMITHLAQIAQHGEVNKMTPTNLSLVFGPTLMTVDAMESSFMDMQEQYKVIENMLIYHEWLFDRERDSDIETDDEDSSQPVVISQATEQEREEKMTEAKKKIVLADQRQSMHKSATAGGLAFILEFVIEKRDRSTVSQTVPVSTTMLAKEARSLLFEKAGIPETSGWVIVESLNNGEMERTLDDEELLLESTLQWPVNSNNRLILRSPPPPEYTPVANPSMSGWLHKEGGKVKNWKKRYFVLRTDGIYYFKDPKSTKELGMFPVSKGLAVYDVFTYARAPTKFCFTVKVPGENTYRYLASENSKEMEQWRVSINAALKAKQ